MQMCKWDSTPRRKINTKDKHYTILRLTTLSGKAIMCIVIFAGETPNTIIDTGLDLRVETFGDPAN